MDLRIWTIGHSTRTSAEFLDLLAQHEIEAVADVRRHPGSRRVPQFGSDALAGSLRANGVEYLWLPGLGGRRRPTADSPNTAWRNPSFRGYADYLHTEPFAQSLVTLENLSHGMRTAVMCAEAVWWRCHRGLIADVLRWLGFEVIHILGPGSYSPHPYTAAARLVRGRLTYASAPSPQRMPEPEKSGALALAAPPQLRNRHRAEDRRLAGSHGGTVGCSDRCRSRRGRGS